jgi:hypothetical protein
MINGAITLMLVYEPATSKRGSVPLVRLDDPALALKVAQAAIAEVEARATQLSWADEFLGEAESAEVDATWPSSTPARRPRVWRMPP